MANLSLVTANKLEVVESIEQFTEVTAEAVNPGQAARLDTSNGKLTKANATVAAEARILGVAVGSKANTAGEPTTIIRKGVVDGFDLSSLAYDAAVYLSNTDGTLADTAGTVSTVVGRVIPGSATTLGTAKDKLLLIDL